MDTNSSSRWKVSRADPPLPLARLRAQGKMFELRADDLRFRRGEVIAFFNRVLGYTPDDTTLATLDQYIEGWVKRGLDGIEVWHTKHDAAAVRLSDAQPRH